MLPNLFIKVVVDLLRSSLSNTPTEYFFPIYPNSNTYLGLVPVKECSFCWNEPTLEWECTLSSENTWDLSELADSISSSLSLLGLVVGLRL